MPILICLGLWQLPCRLSAWSSGGFRFVQHDPMAGERFADSARQRKKTAPSVASRDEIRTATQLFERALADYKGKYDCMLTQLATIDGE